jgi:MFS family permease
MAFGAFLTAYGASKLYGDGGFAYSFMQSFLPDYSPELKMMLLGRFFFGLGAETSIVVVSKILVKWFKGKKPCFGIRIKSRIRQIGNICCTSSLTCFGK